MGELAQDRIRVLPRLLTELPNPDTIRVVHVDDEVDHCSLVRDFLESRERGFEVSIETDPHEALDRLDGGLGSVDCVISDYRMPGMDGLELLRTVRARSPDLPFILFTGRGSEEIASEAISAGVTDYLQKGGGSDQYEILANRIGNAVARYRAEVRSQRALQALEWAREGISLLDEDGRFVYVNHAYADIVGYDREELVDSSWELLDPGGGVEKLRREIVPVISRTGRWESETTYLCRDGNEIAVDQAFAFTEGNTLVSMIKPAG